MRDVRVTSGGNVVPMIPFVKEIIEGVLLGILRTLKKCDPDAELVVTIGPAGDKADYQPAKGAGRPAI